MDLPTARPAPALYVATNLAFFEAIERRPDGDVTEDGTVYRALDAAFYAWLRSRMLLARQHHEAGRLAPAAFEELHRRFTQIHGWALEHLGRDELVRAVREIDLKAYAPPSARAEAATAAPSPTPAAPPAPVVHLFPADGDWPCMAHVTADEVAKVDAIRDSALAAGWSMAALYQNRGALRFPFGRDYGLVAFLDAGDTLGEVTPRSIEVRRPRGSVLRFYNPGGGPADTSSALPVGSG